MIARHSQNYGCCSTDMWDQDIWTGFCRKPVTFDWLHIKTLLSKWKVLFSSVENLWHQSSIHAGIISDARPDLMAHSQSRYRAFFRLFSNYSLTKEVVSKRAFFWQVAHISASLWELQMDPLLRLWNSDDLSACKSLPYLAVCQHITVKRLWTSGWWQLQKSRGTGWNAAADCVVIVQVL